MSDSVYDYNRRCFELLKKKNIYVEGEDNEFTPFYKRYKRYAIQNHPDKKTLIDEEYDVYKRITSCRNLFLNEDMYNDFIRFNTKPVKTEPDQSEPKYRRRRNTKPNYEDEEYTPENDKRQSYSKSSTSERIIPTREGFEKKECNTGRGGWTLLQLKQLCDTLKIPYNSKIAKTKTDFCILIVRYFNESEAKDSSRGARGGFGGDRANRNKYTEDEESSSNTSFDSQQSNTSEHSGESTFDSQQSNTSGDTTLEEIMKREQELNKREQELNKREQEFNKREKDLEDLEDSFENMTISKYDSDSEEEL